MNSLTYEIAAGGDYFPARDKSGSYALYPHRRVLKYKQGKKLRVAEVLDGDAMTPEMIRKRCAANTDWLKRASLAVSPEITDFYVFSADPGEVYISLLESFSGKGYCIVITVPDTGGITIFGDCGQLAHIAEKSYGNDPDEFQNLDRTHAIIRDFNNEILNEMLPNRPVATYALIALTVLVFAIDYVLVSLTGREILKSFGVKQSVLIVAGQYWRLFTPMFLHADFAHLGSNMFSLYILGETVEKYFGKLKFTLIYFLGGLLGNIFSFTLTAGMSLGASGAVFAIGGAVAVIWKTRASRLLRMSGRDLTLVILIGINIALGFSNTGIDNWAHLGGLIGGLLAAYGIGHRTSKAGRQNRVVSIVALALVAIITFYIGYEKWIVYIR